MSPGLRVLRSWCWQHGGDAVYAVVGIFGGTVLLAGYSVLLWRGGHSVTPESVLLAVGTACVLLAAAVYIGQIQTRIHQLHGDLRDKEGYRHFVDHAAEGFFRTGPDGEILEINPALARIYGYQTAQALRAALSRNPQEFYLEIRRRDEFWSQLRAQGKVEDFISKVRRGDGKTIWITENAHSVHDGDGNFLYCEGTVQDITAQREALQATRRALEEAQSSARAKAAFIAAMSHELKTPLNGILGFSELMLSPSSRLDERDRSYIAGIHGSGKRLLDLVNDVIDFARIEGQAFELAETVFRIDEIVRAARDTVLKRPNTPRMILKLPPHLPQLRGDPKRILQVFVNVLSNAVKFTPAQGSVTTKAYRGPEGSLLIEIVDTGIGMPPERIALALEPFRQGDEGLARRFEGLGLGLPLAHALVRLHGGRLAITSAVGKGTTVNIAIPAERVVAEPPAATPAAAARTIIRERAARA